MDEEDSADIGFANNKEKAVVKGKIKLIKVYRNCRA
jgi:hypothetical protein